MSFLDSFTDLGRMVYFGDSLSDAGAVFDYTSDILAIPFPLASAGYAGVFSDGPVYTQTLPQLLGLDSKVYAVGGARATGTQTVSDLLGLGDPTSPIALLVRPDANTALFSDDVNLAGQIGRFVADDTGAPSPQTTVASFLIGLNDLRDLDLASPTVQTDAQVLLQDILDRTFAAAQAAVSSGGVDGLVFYAYPVADFAPVSAGLDAATLALSKFFIDQHEAGLENFATLFGNAGTPATVIQLDQITAEIAADPDTFGLLSKGPILLGGATDPDVELTPSGLSLSFPQNPAVAGLDADQVQFFDFLHPTTAMHGLFAVYSEAVLSRQPTYLDDGNGFAAFGGDDDFVLAKDGRDILFTGAGADIVLGGLQKDRIFGGRDDDILAGGSGNDILRGANGNDILSGGRGHDRLGGGSGDDVIIDGLGDDFVSGGTGNDVFLWVDEALLGGARGSTDIFHGGRGWDSLFLQVSDDILDAVRQDLAATGTGKVWDLPSIGVRAIGVENVRIIGDLGDIQHADADMLTNADLWGFV